MISAANQQTPAIASAPTNLDETIHNIKIIFTVVSGSSLPTSFQVWWQRWDRSQPAPSATVDHVDVKNAVSGSGAGSVQGTNVHDFEEPGFFILDESYWSPTGMKLYHEAGGTGALKHIQCSFVLLVEWGASREISNFCLPNYKLNESGAELLPVLF